MSASLLGCGADGGDGFQRHVTLPLHFHERTRCLENVQDGREPGLYWQRQERERLGVDRLSFGDYKEGLTFSRRGIPSLPLRRKDSSDW